MNAISVQCSTPRKSNPNEARDRFGTHGMSETTFVSFGKGVSSKGVHYLEIPEVLEIIDLKTLQPLLTAPHG